MLEKLQDRRADPLAAVVRMDVQLIEQADTSWVPDVRPDTDERDRECWAAYENREHEVTGEERGKALSQHVGTWRRRVELGVEVVEEPTDVAGITHIGQARSLVAVHLMRLWEVEHHPSRRVAGADSGDSRS